MFITKARHDREMRAARNHARTAGRLASEKVAECDRLTKAFGLVLRVIRRMDAEWGYPAADIASDLDADDKQVRSIIRTLEALGLAKRHPFFSEDDNHIRGSGYSLTVAGEELKCALPDEPLPPALAHVWQYAQPKPANDAAAPQPAA